MAKIMDRRIKGIILHIYFLLRLPFILILMLILKTSSKTSPCRLKILIIRIDRLGDFILTIPVIENLRLHYPEAIIDVLVKPYLKDLAGLIKNIDNVRVLDKKIKAFRRLRKEKYEIVLDMLYDYRIDSAFLAFITGAPVRAGFAWGFRELLFTHIVKPLDYPKAHIVELHLKLLDALKVPTPITVPKIALEHKHLSEIMTIAVHPAGYYKSQRWEAKNFIVLIKRMLGAYDLKVVVIGAPSDTELVNHIVSGVADEKVKAALQNIKDTAILLSGCKLLICNHSGPLHLAAALGVPTVSMMGPANPILWLPRGDNNIVIRKDLKCSPCSRGDCPDHSCFNLITVEEVFDAVKLLLEKVYGIRPSK